MDFRGKDPVVEASAEWLRAAQPSDGQSRRRSSERHRVRRRTRKPNDIRSKIRRRVWLACTGALIAMMIAIYLVIGRQGAGEAGQLGAHGTRGFAALVAYDAVRA